MLHVKSGDKELIVLGPVSLEQLRSGQSICPQGTNLELRFSPDVVWLGGAIATASAAGILNDEILNALHQESMERRSLLSSPPDEHKQIIRSEVLRGD